MSRTGRPDAAVTAGELRGKLVDDLVSTGTIHSEWVRAAFESVPRDVFVPRFHRWDGARQRLVDSGNPDDREEWLRSVYTDQALTVQLTAAPDVTDPDGLPSSSSSMPTVMAGMLEALDVRPGHRVLEIGTGTGYNAALLSWRVQDHHVTSVELDPRVADAARGALAEVGLHPTVHVGDGAGGVPHGGRFDRICATAAVDHIPPAWIEQLAPGGVLVANLRGSLAGGLVRLTTGDDDHRVTGRFLEMPGAFMPMRSRLDSPHRDGENWDEIAFDLRNPQVTRTAIDPAVLEDRSFRHLLQLHLAGRRLRGFAPGRASGALVSGRAVDGSWFDLDPSGAGPENQYVVRQGGTLRLWDTVEAVHVVWRALDRPPPTRFTVVADTGAQYIRFVAADAAEWRWPMPL